MSGCIWYTYQSAAAAMLGRSTTPPYLHSTARHPGSAAYSSTSASASCIHAKQQPHLMSARTSTICQVQQDTYRMQQGTQAAHPMKMLAASGCRASRSVAPSPTITMVS
jgi:hypothetical protein